MLSTFPPKPCGVGTYAQDHFLSLKDQGHVVYTQSYDDGSAANFQASNATIRGLLKSIGFLFGPSYDVVYIHFTNGLFWPQPHTRGWRYPVSKFLEYLWSLLLFLRYYKKIVIVGHEITTEESENPARLCRALFFRGPSRFVSIQRRNEERFFLVFVGF